MKTTNNPIFQDDIFKRCLTVCEGDEGTAKVLRLLHDAGGRVALTNDDGVDFIEMTDHCKALLAKVDPLRYFN